MNDELNEAPDAGEQVEDQVDQKILDEASADGWKPKEYFHGPEEQWVDAETFVKRGREINPILRKNNEKLQREIASLKAQLDTTNLSLSKVQEYHNKLEERVYERAIKDLKAQRKTARSEGDDERVDELEEQLEDMQGNKPVAQEPAKATPAMDASLTDWMEDQKSWFNNQNQDMMDYANAVGIRLRREDPDNKLIGKDFLDKITSAVRKQYPEKFGNRRGAPAAVGGGGESASSSGATASSGKGLGSLPPEARQAFKELSREKWYIDLAKKNKMTPEQMYVNDYQG